MTTRVEMHVLHASLWRPILFGGTEPGFVIVEVSTVLALLFVIGIHIATAALALGYATVVHAAAVWVTSQDAMMSRIYLRSLGVRDYYAPIARAQMPPRPVRPSIPSIR